MNNKIDNNGYKKEHKYNLFQSFAFAFHGIWFGLKWERNLRIHLCTAVIVSYFSARYYDFSKAEIAALILAMAMVITAELINTAIEKAADLKSPEWNPLAKFAKDVAAAAVLVASFASLVVGIVLLWDKDILLTILRDILNRLYIWIPILAVMLGLIFIPEMDLKTRLNGKENKNDH